MRRLLLAVLLAVLALPAAAGAAVPRDFFGAMANGPLDQPDFDLASESAQMRASGVRSERMEISWDLAEPSPGQYALAPYDRKVLAAATAGIDVLALVVRSPSWAAVQPGKPFSPPKDPATYAAFLKAMVARYGPQRLAVGRAPRGPQAAGARLADLERAEHRQLLVGAAVHARLRPAAEQRLRRGQGRRQGRHRGHGRASRTTPGATSRACIARAGASCASTSRRCTRSAGGRRTA